MGNVPPVPNEPRLSLQTLRVLSVMMESPSSDHYGLEIAKATGLSSGTLYPILARLERYKWLDSDWENIDPSTAGRRPRRYYRFTPNGIKRAREAIQETTRLLAGKLGVMT